MEEGAEVSADAEVGAPALLAAGVEVAAGATVGPRAVLGAGTTVAADAIVQGSVLLPTAGSGKARGCTRRMLADGRGGRRPAPRRRPEP